MTNNVTVVSGLNTERKFNRSVYLNAGFTQQILGETIYLSIANFVA
jgi:hypothetical protein